MEFPFDKNARVRDRDETYCHVYLRYAFNGLSATDRDRFWRFVFDTSKPDKCPTCHVDDVYEGKRFRIFTLT